MAKKNSLTLGFENHNRTAIASTDQVAPIGMKTLVFRLVKTLSSYRCNRQRRRASEGYISRNSPEDETRLEFQRFLYW
jgi:hypothetical protein